MFFKVDYEKVSDIGNSLAVQTEKINTLYHDIVNICKSIDENWRSKDSSIYVYRFVNYIDSKMRENENLNVAGNALKDISSVYSEQDNKWLNELVRNSIGEGRIE